MSGHLSNETQGLPSGQYNQFYFYPLYEVATVWGCNIVIAYQNSAEFQGTIPSRTSISSYTYVYCKKLKLL